MVISQIQHNMVKIKLLITANDPGTGEEIFNTEWIKFRHADSFYEEY